VTYLREKGSEICGIHSLGHWRGKHLSKVAIAYVMDNPWFEK